MSKSEILNPSAFPVSSPATGKLNTGMSLRDYFAAAALTGMLSNSEGFGIDDNTTIVSSYRIADLMLEERMKEK